jgi:hypothetical protein
MAFPGVGKIQEGRTPKNRTGYEADYRAGDIENRDSSFSWGAFFFVVRAADEPFRAGPPGIGETMLAAGGCGGKGGWDTILELADKY